MTRKVGDDERPLASFAVRSDAEYYLKNPKYAGKLKIIFNAQDSDVAIEQSVYHAKITNPREFQGFVIAEGVEMNPRSHRYEGIVNNPLTKRSHKYKLHEDFPDTLFGYKVIWLIGEP